MGLWEAFWTSFTSENEWAPGETGLRHGKDSQIPMPPSDKDAAAIYNTSYAIGAAMREAEKNNR